MHLTLYNCGLAMATGGGGTVSDGGANVGLTNVGGEALATGAASVGMANDGEPTGAGLIGRGEFDPDP